MAKVSKEKLALKRAKLEARLSELDDRLYKTERKPHSSECGWDVSGH